MNVQTIIFDFGNVIGHFDHAPALAKLASYGDLSAERILSEAYTEELEDAYEAGRISTAEFLGRLRTLCGLRCTDEEAAAAVADIFWPNEPVCALLPRLKPHYRLLLGSNTNELHSRQFLRQFADVLRYFDHLVLSHDAGARKPRREFFAHAQRFAECEPGACLFIDDLAANIAGAVAFGWQGIVYREHNDLVRRLTALDIKGLPDERS